MVTLLRDYEGVIIFDGWGCFRVQNYDAAHCSHPVLVPPLELVDQDHFVGGWIPQPHAK